MLVASLKTNWLLFSVFGALTLAFLLLAIGALGEHPEVTKAGGWSGLLTAGLAWYGSMAGVTNATWGRAAIPTWPVKK